MRMPPQFARGGGKQVAGLPDRCGHDVPEERPQEVVAALEAFFVE